VTQQEVGTDGTPQVPLFGLFEGARSLAIKQLGLSLYLVWTPNSGECGDD